MNNSLIWVKYLLKARDTYFCLQVFHLSWLCLIYRSLTFLNSWLSFFLLFNWFNFLFWLFLYRVSLWLLLLFFRFYFYFGLKFLCFRLLSFLDFLFYLRFLFFLDLRFCLFLYFFFLFYFILIFSRLRILFRWSLFLFFLGLLFLWLLNWLNWLLLLLLFLLVLSLLCQRLCNRVGQTLHGSKATAKTSSAETTSTSASPESKATRWSLSTTTSPFEQWDLRQLVAVGTLLRLWFHDCKAATDLNWLWWLRLLDDNTTCHDWSCVVTIKLILAQERSLWHSRVQIPFGQDWCTRHQIDLLLICIVNLLIVNLGEIVVLIECFGEPKGLGIDLLLVLIEPVVLKCFLC